MNDSETVLNQLHAMFVYRDGEFIWTNPPRKAHRAVIGTAAGRPDGRGYKLIRILGHSYKRHRLVWLYHTGKWPAGQLDHIDMDRSNDRIENLREATPSQQCANKRYHAGRFLPGVRKQERGRFLADITVRMKKIRLGRFDTEEEAHAAYLAAREKFFGEYANNAKPKRRAA